MPIVKKFDCIIVGGGMVGAASALSLAQLGLSVAVVEQYQPQEFSPEQALDLRVSAISLASQNLLEQLGAWQQIIQWRSCSYQQLAVWEKQFAYTEFNAKEIAQAHLGHMIENRLLQLSLWQQIKQAKNICLFCPETLKSYQQQEQHIEVLLGDMVIHTRLLIAADGANSKVRQLANIGVTGWNYQQSAMLINVQTQLAQQSITWQQFLPTGPVAMLPMPTVLPANNSDSASYNGCASLVWYHHRDEIKRLSALSNKQLQDEVHRAFPPKLGKIAVVSKAAFPLTRRHANSYQKGQVILLGDAAHTINPLAGQGVNLGFKDVMALQTVIAEAIGNGELWYQPHVLRRYEKKRRADNLLMMTAMDSLYNAFSHPSTLVKTLRNSVFFMINRTPMLKSKVLRHACGLE
jgi:3-demethoxyubiquinol 3-hydroxylase